MILEQTRDIESITHLIRSSTRSNLLRSLLILSWGEDVSDEDILEILLSHEIDPQSLDGKSVRACQWWWLISQSLTKLVLKRFTTCVNGKLIFNHSIRKFSSRNGQFSGFFFKTVKNMGISDAHIPSFSNGVLLGSSSARYFLSVGPAAVSSVASAYLFGRRSGGQPSGKARSSSRSWYAHPSSILITEFTRGEMHGISATVYCNYFPCSSLFIISMDWNKSSKSDPIHNHIQPRWVKKYWNKDYRSRQIEKKLP